MPTQDFKGTINGIAIAAAQTGFNTIFAGLLPRTITYTAADTTPSVLSASFMQVANAGPVTISNFDDGVSGQLLILKFDDANTTISRDNARLANSANFTSANYAFLVLMKIGAEWVEITRSVANG